MMLYDESPEHPRAHETGCAPPGHLLAGSEGLLTHFYRWIVELVAPEHDAP